MRLFISFFSPFFCNSRWKQTSEARKFIEVNVWREKITQDKINNTLSIIVLFSVEKSLVWPFFSRSAKIIELQTCSCCIWQFFSFLPQNKAPGSTRKEIFQKTLDLSFIFLSFLLAKRRGNDKCFWVRRQTSRKRWMAWDVENKFPFLLNFAVITFMSYSFFSLLP